ARLGADAADPVRSLRRRRSPDRAGMPRAGRARRTRRPPRRHAVRRRAAARGHRSRACTGAVGDPGRRADGEPRPRADRQHHGPAQAHQRAARSDAGRESASARDRGRLRDAHRRLPTRSCRLRRSAGASDAAAGGGDLRRGSGPVKRATLVIALAVLAWTAWDTGADPIRLGRGIPWLLDFLRRMLPPDLRVLPAALVGALKTLEIALLGTAMAAAIALPLGFLSARNVASPTVFHPARVTLNFLRSIDTLVYALVFVAA